MAVPRSTRYRYDVFLSHSSADKPLVREYQRPLDCPLSPAGESGLEPG